MQNLVGHRTMSGKTCPQLVEILGLPLKITGNFCQILLYIQWCDMQQLAMTGQQLKNNQNITQLKQQLCTDHCVSRGMGSHQHI